MEFIIIVFLYIYDNYAYIYLFIYYDSVCITKCITYCGAKGSGRPGPFRIISPRAQPKRKTSEDD